MLNRLKILKKSLVRNQKFNQVKQKFKEQSTKVLMILKMNKKNKKRERKLVADVKKTNKILFRSIESVK